MPRIFAAAILTALAIMLVFPPSVASVPITAVDTTLTVKDTGAIHLKVIQTVPDNNDGATNYHFDLQKMYLPDYVFVYDYATGKPLKFNVKEMTDVYGYDVYFDKPYYEGYRFVVEYDSHKRIIYEGSGVYSLSMRPAIDTRTIDRKYTVILPARNFTYLGYNAALDHPESETDKGGSSTWIVFHNLSNAGASYAWEVRFGAAGIDDEVRKVEVPNFGNPIPGMSFIAAITALVILAIVKKR
jgi:hypothetical protein